MLKTFLGLLFRHLLTSGGGAIVAQGIITGDQLNQIIGAGTTLFGVALSTWQKYQAKQAANATPPKYNP